jgi:hypothetical protein
LYRVVSRTYRRWRSKENLWGTNYEQFWPIFKVWNKDDSLVYWIVRQGIKTPKRICDLVSDPQYAHIQFIRLGSRADITKFQQLVVKQLNQSRGEIAGALQAGL